MGYLLGSSVSGVCYNTLRSSTMVRSGLQVKLNLLIGNHEEIRSKTGMSTSTVQSWVLASSSRCSMYIRMCYMCSMYVTYLSA